MIKKGLFLWGLLQLICFSCLFTTTLADENPFVNVQTGRDLILQANQKNFYIEFRKVLARTIVDFDRVTNIRVRGHYIYADWINTYRIKSYHNQQLSKIQQKFENSAIKLEIEYVVTKNVAQYGMIYQQSLRPGSLVIAKSPPYRPVQSKSNLFKKPVLNNSGGNYTSSYSYSRQYHYHNTNGDVVLKLKVFTMEPVEMIDLTGLTFQEAKKRLSDIGMPVGYIQDTYEKTYEANLYGKIFKQSIPVGTLLTEPKMMGVMIYSFPETKMPDLTKGWTLDKANQEPYLIVVPNYIITSDISKDRLIIEQNIQAGNLLIKKTSVVVKVYRYKNPFYAPDYLGVQQEEAVKLLIEKNLNYRVETKDIFEHFKSTFDLEFIKKNDKKVVAAKKQGETVLLTVLQYSPKSDVMPNLMGKDCQSAIRELIGLKKQIPGLTYTTEYIPTQLIKNDGRVVNTEPVAFATIKSFDTIRIFCGKAKITNIDEIKAMVPDLRGQTADEARQELVALGFSKIVVAKEKKVGAVDGTVVDLTNQIEMSTIGYKAFKSEKITLHIADIEAIEMPVMGHYAGLSPQQAKKFLLHLGYRNFEFESEADSFVKYQSDRPAGKVIATSPRWKTKLMYGKDTLITLIVRVKPGEVLPEKIHLNPPNKSETVKVPGLQKTLVDTIKILEANDLVPEINYEITKVPYFKDKLKPGSVPAWNTIVKRGSKVGITVYTLKAVVPPVTIFDEKAAVSLIEKSNLKAELSYVLTDIKSQDKKVQVQDPIGGTLMDPESIVKLKIYQFSGMTTMPNILFRQYGESVTTLLSVYFNLDHKVVEIPTEFEEDDKKIIKTVPVAGAKVKEGTHVELHVYTLSKDAKRRVPNVKYLTVEEAKKDLEKKGLKIQINYIDSQIKAMAGRINDQIPLAEVRVAPGSLVMVNVNRYVGINVPGFSKEPVEKAETFFKTLGFKYSVKEIGTSDFDYDGLVGRTSPAENTILKPGSTITIYKYIYTGQLVPNLIGKKLSNDRLRTLFYDLGINFVIKERETPFNVEIGKILDVNPKPETNPQKGSTITIYKGIKLTKIPDVMGKSEADATKIFEDLGFAVRKYHIADSAAHGTVFFQSQKPGNPLLHAAITLGISKGSDTTSTIREFYHDKFKAAYESMDEYQVISLISDSWGSNDGNSITELEDNLHNIFNVYDQIQCTINGLIIQQGHNGTYEVTYSVAIKGTIFESDIIHTETSSVRELVAIEGGKVKILKTLNGNFWSIE